MMTLENCVGNWNHMYEWRNGDYWYPCYVIEEETPIEGMIAIYTRNGVVIHESPENVRRMSRETYVYNSYKCIEFLGDTFTSFGFHASLEEDIGLFNSIPDVIEIINTRSAARDRDNEDFDYEQ